jgi:hypothetical protein
MSAHKMRRLLDAREEGPLTPEQEAELQRLLAGDPAAQRMFLDHQLLVSSLREALAGRPLPLVRAPEPARAWLRRLAFSMAAVVLLSAGAYAAWRLRRPAPSAGRPPAPTVALDSAAARTGQAPPARVPAFARPSPGSAPMPIENPVPAEIVALRRVPRALLERIQGQVANPEGFVKGNEMGFQCSGDQRFGIHRMIVGVAHGQAALVDEAWRAITATFSYQAADGSFLDPPSCTSYWLGDLSHGLLLLRESELGATYAERVEALLPKIAAAASWLRHPNRVRHLERAARRLESQNFFHAVAYGATGVLLADRELETLGRSFMQRGLDLQEPGGAFVVKGGPDPGYQGAILWKLAVFHLRLPDPRVEQALHRGARWMIGRVDPAGRIDVTGASVAWNPRCPVKVGGRCKGLNYDEIAWGLAYYGALFDAQALDVAARVSATRAAIGRAPPN